MVVNIKFLVRHGKYNTFNEKRLNLRNLLEIRKQINKKVFKIEIFVHKFKVRILEFIWFTS